MAYNIKLKDGQKCFNLITEPWIVTLSKSREIKIMGLNDVFKQAHELRCLQGEARVQDFSILRLLVATCYTVMENYTVDGEYAPLHEICDTEEATQAALSRWQSYWAKKKFGKVFTDYLAQRNDRFWLFHPTRPFYQVSPLVLYTDHLDEYGTYFQAAKLIGTISQSSNKRRLFSSRSKEARSCIPFDEAARWLVFQQAVSDNALKKKGPNKSQPSVGVGWAAQTSLLELEGANLFETIMLNSVMLRDGEEPWGVPACPVWDAEEVDTRHRVKIPVPQDPAALLTNQCRRIILEPEEDIVIGFWAQGGTFFDSTNAFSEQMTAWSSKKKNGNIVFYPKKIQSNQYFWENFCHIFDTGDGKTSENFHKSGLVGWLNTLEETEIISDKVVGIHCHGVSYGPMSSMITDMYDERFYFPADLLFDDAETADVIGDELMKCEDLSKAIFFYVKNALCAAGFDPQKKIDDPTQDIFKRKIEDAFEKWLLTEKEITDDSVKRWRETVRQLVYKSMDAIETKLAPAVYAGHYNKRKDTFYTLADAQNSLFYQLHKVYPEENYE